jgi:hypothetical protein
MYFDKYDALTNNKPDIAKLNKDLRKLIEEKTYESL